MAKDFNHAKIMVSKGKDRFHHEKKKLRISVKFI
jgi:hypothetical protein